MFPEPETNVLQRRRFQTVNLVQYVMVKLWAQMFQNRAEFGKINNLSGFVIRHARQGAHTKGMTGIRRFG